MNVSSGDEVDFFVSRAGSDKAIAQTVASILESAGYRVILQDWDFGHANFVAKMDDALARSGRIVTLLSRAYLASPYCSIEWQAVFARDPRNFDQRLVLLRIDECQPTGILCTLAYTDLVPLIQTPQVLADVLLARVNPGRLPASSDAAAAYQRTARPVLHPDVGPVANFTSRDVELAQIDEALASGTAHVAVHGLAGVGKSALAREFGWRRRDGYAGVWIVNAESAESIIASLIGLGARFIAGLDQVQHRPEAARLTLDQVLPSFERPWLLIYDNLESEASLRQWGPKGNARVLVTSRIQSFSAAVRKVALESWPSSQSVEYVRQESGRDDLADADVAGIAEDLAGLPLALAHAAAYLRENPAVAAAGYRDRLAQHLGRVPPGFEGQPSVFATYQAAIEAVDKRHAGAAMLMGVAAWLAPDGIPRELFTQQWARHYDSLAPLAVDGLRLDETLSALARSSLIRYSTATQTFSLHRLVQASARRDRVELYAAFGLLRDMCPDVEFATWSQCDRLILHAIAVMTAIGPEASDDAITPIWCARLCNRIGEYLRQRGQHASAEPWLRSALALNLNAALRGPDHPDVGMNLRNLARLLEDTARVAEAEPLYRRALEIAELNYGGDDPRLVVDLAGLANLLQKSDRTSEAESLYGRALRIVQTSAPSTDQDAAEALHNRAFLLYNINRFDEAETLYRQALGLLERTSGPNEPQVAKTLHDLGSVLRRTNRPAEAEAMLRRAVIILLRCSEETGAIHPKLRLAITSLRRVYETGDRGDRLLLEQLSSIGSEAGLDAEETSDLLAWWQDADGQPST